MQKLRKGLYQPKQDFKGASKIDQETKIKFMQDNLLEPFSVAQKEFIIENLY